MRVLLVNPETPESFLTFRDACEFLGRKAMTPPLGLITVAALLPAQWEFRLVDLVARRLTDADWDWADMVMLSAMIVQRDSLLALIRVAKQRGEPVPAVQGVEKTSLGDKLQDLSRFLRLSWKQGVRSNHKIQYWKQLLGVWRHNPSRLVKYLNDCGLGQNMFSLKRIIHESIGEAVKGEGSRPSGSC